MHVTTPETVPPARSRARFPVPFSGWGSAARGRTALIYCVLFLVGFAWLAVRLGTDGTPDFKIYHFYNGFAAHHDRSGDIFPAQLQTAVFPGLDAVYYLVFHALNDHPALLNVLLSIPYGLAAALVFWLARLFLPVETPLRHLACAAVAIFGTTGVGALPNLATTMSDLVPALPLLAALTAWLYLERDGRSTWWSALLLGALGGLSVGLKLTQAPLFVGLFCAVALRRLVGARGAAAQAIAFGVAGALGFLLLDGRWLLGNLRAYGNPLFPYANQLFRSDLVSHESWRDLRFLPRSALMALLYPAYWAFRPVHLASELDLRDARILIGCASTLVVLGAHALRRLRGVGPAPAPTEALGFRLGISFLVAYVLWELLWGYQRYLTALEPLVGVLLVAALSACLGRRVGQGWIVAALAAILALTMATTRYPWWSRAQRSGQVYSVRLPAIEPDAMVVLLDPYAYSYLVPAMPESVRVIGANNNLVHPGSWGKLEGRIEAAVREHRGPLWGMEYPAAFPEVADRTLEHHGLARAGGCSLVDTNIEERPIVRICRLERRD